MSVYSLAFKYVASLMKKGDDKIHQNNIDRKDIKVTVCQFQNKKKSNLLNVVQNQYSIKGQLQPLIFDCHGGGYFYSDKDNNLYFNKWLAEKGYVVVAPSYTLLFKATIKQMMQEIFEAFSYVLKHAEEYHIDLKNIYLTGDSVGAHLVFLLVAINQSDELQKEFEVNQLPIQFKKIAVNNPVCYTERIQMVPDKPSIDKGAHKWLMKKLCGKRNSAHLYLYDACSIDKLIRYLQVIPPTFITSSLGDTMFYSQAMDLEKLLTSNGHNVKTYVVPDKTFSHVYNVLAPDDERSASVNQSLVDFFH